MQSQQINELAAALAKAQGAFEDVVKGKKAEVGKYSYTYADLATVLQAVRKPLSDNGLALAQLTHSENGSFWLESCLMHTSGQYITATWPLPAQGTPQQIGSALTYGRRYTASALLGIASEDDDGAAGGDVKPSGGPPKTEAKEERPTSSTGGAGTNGAGSGEPKEWINVFTKEGNHQTFERNVRGARQAVFCLEELMAEDPTVWWANEEWAAEICAKIGTAKDPDLKDETKAKLTLAERLQFLESQAPDQANILDAG